MRPIAPSARDGRLLRSVHAFFGAVVLTPNAMFVCVDGYSNGYWGGGWEDVDLKKRYVTIGIVPGRRLSTFLPLDHDNRGFMLDGKPAPISIVNQRIYDDNG